MSVHCRCRACRKRATLPKAPADYRVRAACPRCKGSYANDDAKCFDCGADMLLAPRCKSCGGRLRLDQDANARPWRRQALCHCGGVWFAIRGAPHRMGGGQCIHNEKNHQEK